MKSVETLREGIPSRAEVRQRGYGCTSEEEAAIKAWQERWIVENREAIESWNLWVKEHGLPLAKYRLF